MARQVICIAMTTGAHAEEVGRMAAEQLGYHYISDEIIDWAAEYAGVSRQTVEAVEHSRPLVRRIHDATARGDVPRTETPPLDQLDPDAASPAYRHLIQAVIREIAVRGNVVIIAHAAAILLAGMPGLLRVLVTASPEVRAARLMSPTVDTREAARRIAHSDRERRAYFQRFYDLKQELPTHYDLVVNTDVLTPEAAAHVIVCAAKS